MVLDATRLLYFGGGSKSYTFPPSQTDYKDNFGDSVSKITTVSGMDGGLDGFGTRAAPVSVGTINASFVIVTRSRAEMTVKRDAIKAMQYWGVQKLWMQPSDNTLPPRFCLARVNTPNIPEQRDQHSDIVQRFSLQFQVSDPRWLGYPNGSYFNDDNLFNDGLTFNSPRFSSTAINNGSQITLTNNGDTHTPVKLHFRAGANSVTHLAVNKVSGSGRILTGWRWENTLLANEQLIVDSTPLPAVEYIPYGTTGNRSGYPEFKRNADTGFILLEPGANTLHISGTFTGNISLKATYFDAWR